MVEKIIEINGRKLKIRQLKKEDKEIFFEFFQALSERTKDFFHPHSFDRQTAEKLCNENNQEILRFITVEEINSKEKIIGYTLLFGLSGDFPELGICIRDDCQEKGLGKILMEHLIETTKKLGKKGLSLSVYKDNERAFKLYKKCGFEIERTTHFMKLKF